MSMMNKRAALEIALCAHFGWFSMQCMCCGAKDKPLRLHHVLRRGLFQNKDIEEYMPVCAYSCICDSCNNNSGPFVVDSPSGRAILLAKQADALGGLDVIYQDILEFAARLPNGLNEEIVNWAEVKIQYNKRNKENAEIT